MKIDAKGTYYKELNKKVREVIGKSPQIELFNVNGQRYIGCGVRSNAMITINGVPGNDLAAFMDGLTIEVSGNCQDCTGNTMNSGKIIVHGDAGDVVGYAMRNGKIFVKGNAGYRVGIHMKEYKESIPVIVIGGSAGDFLGEYMAGGRIILLNLNNDFDGDYIGTGMHGGAIYIRGDIDKSKIAKGVNMAEITEEEESELRDILKEFCKDMKMDEIKGSFKKLIPSSLRPYGQLYSY